MSFLHKYKNIIDSVEYEYLLTFHKTTRNVKCHFCRSTILYDTELEETPTCAICGKFMCDACDENFSNIWNVEYGNLWNYKEYTCYECVDTFYKDNPSKWYIRCHSCKKECCINVKYRETNACDECR